MLNFTTSRIVLNISFSPITQTNQINKKANIKLALILEGAATYFLVLPTVDECFFFESLVASLAVE